VFRGHPIVPVGEISVDRSTTASRFQTTSWTLIRQARTGREELGRFLGAYWRPIYAYIRTSGLDCHSARDLTQQFIVKVIEKDLLGKADAARGRFRSFLLKALDNFVIDEHRAASGRDGTRPTMFVPEDVSALAAVEPDPADPPARAFSRQWATTIMDVALLRLELCCREEGLEPHWRAFESLVLSRVRGCAPPPAEAIAADLHARDRQHVYSMVNTVKRKARRVYREVVAETLDDPDLLEAELADLRQFVAI
jgi:DNA-directed RNA polymerase specialized sigma24 family protein